MMSNARDLLVMKIILSTFAYNITPSEPIRAHLRIAPLHKGWQSLIVLRRCSEIIIFRGESISDSVCTYMVAYVVRAAAARR